MISETQRIIKFLISKEAEGLTHGTIKFYRDKLTDLPELETQAIRAWLIKLRETHNPGGVHAYYRALHAYCTWIEDEYDIPNPIRKVKAPKVPEEILDPIPQAVVDALLMVCKDSWHGIRDKAVIMVLDSTGIRAGELTALKIDDVDLGQSVLYINHGKGGYPRAVDFDKRTKRALKAWINVRYDLPSFFHSSYRNPLDLDSLRSIIENRSKQAGVKPFGMHAFRRKHALDLHRAGESLLLIQRRLGHHSDAVLKRYIKLSREDMILAARRTKNYRR